MAETLFVSVPVEMIYDNKYALGMGLSYEKESLKFEHGCKFKKKNENVDWKKYCFTETTYLRKIPQLLDIEIGTGLDHITLENNQNMFLEEYHTKLVISRGFRYKQIEFSPSIVGEIPISNRDDVYSNYLNKRIRVALDINYYF